MLFSVEVLDLLLYCVQQAGVMLAVGAETVVLISYIVAFRDGKIDESEAKFSKMVHRALMAGIIAMVASGLAITALHASIGQLDIILTPVFLFKWLLIVAAISISVVQRGRAFTHFLIEGLAGATWYALFMVHIVAPITSWINLIGLYVLFVAVFLMIWSGIVKTTRGREGKPKAAAVSMPRVKPAVISSLPKPIALPVMAQKPAPIPAPVIQNPSPVIVKPAATVAVVPPPALSAPPPVALPTVPVLAPPPAVAVPSPVPAVKEPAPATPDTHRSIWLPAIHFMPKDQKQVDDKSHIIPLSALTKSA